MYVDMAVFQEIAARLAAHVHPEELVAPVYWPLPRVEALYAGPCNMIFCTKKRLMLYPLPQYFKSRVFSGAAVFVAHKEWFSRAGLEGLNLYLEHRMPYKLHLQEGWHTAIVKSLDMYNMITGEAASLVAPQARAVQLAGLPPLLLTVLARVQCDLIGSWEWCPLAGYIGSGGDVANYLRLRPYGI